MKKSLFYLSLIFFSAAVFFTACKKSDNAKNLEQDVMTSEDLAESEDFDQQLDFDADIAIEERGGTATCPVVTMDQPYGTWPNTITVDFGTGCDFNGRHFTGKIIISQTADILSAGAVRTRTFDGFSVDDIQIEGTKTWTNNGLNADGNWSYTKTATGMKHTFSDGTSRSWNANHTSVLFEGTATPTHWDNAWSTTGSASGVNRAGQAYTATITEPLIKRATCRWISQGVVEFTRDDRSATLDYGDGSCDRFGTLTTDNGNTVTIRLRQ